ncbi:MAG: ATP-dependent RecD-like DNA helicase [Myxococcales bacterium]|nr:ATP-dependent RecD-like DNA helicase [Myxococcales bacterium]
MDLFERAAGKGHAAPVPTEEVIREGTLERIVFAGHDGAFTVARLKVEGAAELETIVGALPGVPEGARLRVRGSYEDNPRFGRQLKLASYTELAPETLEGIRRYLGSGLVKGIGREMASRIVDRFGMATLEILDREPYRIAEVPGIGKGRAQAFRQAWLEQKGVRDVMVFLQGHGVSPAFAARIYKRYGAAAVARVRDNPYRLAFDVWGIGFLSADRLATSLGVAKDAAIRIEAGLRHVLDEANGGGHVFVPRLELERLAAERLGVDEALVRPAVDVLGREGVVALDSVPEHGEIVYETGLFRAEREVALALVRLRNAPPRVHMKGDVAAAVARYEAAAGLALAPAQREAIGRALGEKVLVVTGGPGVGKTTIVRGVVQLCRAAGLTVALAAPTGRAAKRLAEATGLPAGTLHRLLEWRPKEAAFARNAENPLEADLLVVDEASMLDVRLAADLVAAVSEGTRLVFVGDVDQLPSVGPGAVLADLIGSGVIATVRLTEIFRQAARSLIVTNAHRINAGAPPEFGAPPENGAPDERDFFFLEEPDPQKAAETVRDLVVTRLPKRYGLSHAEIQVLVPMHRGDLGALRLNHLLQEALTAGAAEIARGERLFRVGDRVMQVRNDYDKDVFNGDVGHVTAIEGDTLTATFEGRSVTYENDELDQLALAYAATVHKSQGSEYAAVVLPVHTQHFVMLQRNLLYTAVTRGKRLVVMVGTRKALGLAVRNEKANVRHSRLAERLRQAARV